MACMKCCFSQKPELNSIATSKSVQVHHNCQYNATNHRSIHMRRNHDEKMHLYSIRHNMKNWFPMYNHEQHIIDIIVRCLNMRNKKLPSSPNHIPVHKFWPQVQGIKQRRKRHLSLLQKDKTPPGTMVQKMTELMPSVV